MLKPEAEDPAFLRWMQEAIAADLATGETLDLFAGTPHARDLAPLAGPEAEGPTPTARVQDATAEAQASDERMAPRTTARMGA